MSIIYREAELEDADALIEFMHIAGDETDNLSFSGSTFNISIEKEERFLRKYKNSKRDIMLVATVDGKLVANASITANRVERYSHRGELSIVILKEYWHRGIGSALMERMIDFSKRAGLEVLYLEVRSDNVAAVKLYEKYGFTKLGEFKSFFKIGQNYHDAYLMTLYL